jgi:hypothetical protein
MITALIGCRGVGKTALLKRLKIGLVEGRLESSASRRRPRC